MRISFIERKRFLFGLAILFFSIGVRAETGVSDTEVKIGSSNSMTGDIGEIGTGMANGGHAYYNRINAAGGIEGRKIKFLPLDDVYDPAKAVANARTLIEKEHVFALVGGNGTPIAQAIMPLVEENGLMFLFTFTGGAIVFPNPPRKNIFQVRISYADEATSLVKFMVDKLAVKNIGVFYQDDAFGVAGRSGVEKTLAAYGLKLNGIGTYQRNTTDVDKAIAELKKANPQAVYMQSVAKPGLVFIKKCIEQGFKPIFLGPSALGSLQLRDALVGLPVEMYISEIVPSPLDPSLPLVRNFQADMTAIGRKTFDFFSLEGYMGAMLFGEGLRRTGKSPTRAALGKNLEAMSDFDMGGVKASFSPKKHSALDTNFVFHLKDGKLTPVK